MGAKVNLIRPTYGGIARRPPSRSSLSTLRRWRYRVAQVREQRKYSEQATQRSATHKDPAATESEQGAMSRRLEEMTEDSLMASPRRSKKMVEEAGFSGELKRQLEERIASGNLAPDNQQAQSVASMPSYAGKGTREVAEARPWSGSEKMEETALRMLEDAHKPLKADVGRRPIKLPPVDMRLKALSKSTTAQRLANARDKSSIYSLSQDSGMSEKEREETRRLLKERFQPGARSMPATIQGLQSLASERIEDAIARGVFKNIPRGKGVNVERDHQASNPFLDTTEYFMNKIIQKQEVLPPWVEKQQEVTRTIATFRARLRSEWKRHAARAIASKGGTLAQQIRRAERYALAEAAANPRAVKEERLAGIDAKGNLTRVTVTETPPEQAVDPNSAAHTITVTQESTTQSRTVSLTADPPLADPAPPTLPSAEAAKKMPPPFRDPDWEKTELSYHTLALNSLNNLTRSYNLMAPELAKKPYFNLGRELRNCYADVAPLIAQEIRERARAPPEKKSPWEAEGHRPGSVMAKFTAGEKVRVWESRRPHYGFKEFWRDVWGE